MGDRMKQLWKNRRAVALALALPVFMAAAMLAPWLFHSIFGSGPSSAPSFRPQVPHEDRRAYEELRKHGCSGKEAQDAAASTRRLCEAAGGTDCQ